LFEDVDQNYFYFMLFDMELQTLQAVYTFTMLLLADRTNGRAYAACCVCPSVCHV